MCGIAGIVGSGESNKIENINAMLSTMAHRGPDGEGIWQKDSVLFGHRRLSIIDLYTGSQPLVINRDGKSHAIVFNGEIYNYKKLRAKLVDKGMTFNTESDTEVLLRMLMDYDQEYVLNELNGMFAFAWWDADKQRLTLARDRIGIKPLYYCLDDSNTLFFASSLESIAIVEEVKKRFNPEALDYYLTLGFTPAPLTFYSGIYEMQPGELLTWNNKEINKKYYWKVDWHNCYKGSEDEARAELDELLSVVVQDHLVSDVPIAAFLSGGIDSSAIVAKLKPFVDKNFETYTVSFPDKRYDESKTAGLIAKHLGIKNNVISMEELKVDADICNIILRNCGQPLLDSSCLPTYLISKSVSNKYKVVLSGDGGDELFAGYDYFAWGSKINQIQKVPSWLRNSGLNIISRFSTTSRMYSNRLRQIRKALKYSLLSQEDVIIRLMSTIDPEEWADLSIPHGIKLDRINEFLNDGRELDFNNALSRFLTCKSLPGVMLRKVDSMSMAASIEVRVPFLDHRVVEFAHSLPFSMKVRKRERKAILRDVVRKELPPEVFNKKKQGFAMPLFKAFDKEFLSFSRDVLLDVNSNVRNYFGFDYLNELLKYNETLVSPIPHIWSIYTVNHALWMMVLLELFCVEKKLSIPFE